MNCFRSVAFVAAVFLTFSAPHAIAAEEADVCELASEQSAAVVLGTRPTPLQPSEMGEETAPYCLWATANRKKSIKLQVWSKTELQVVGVYDAKTYFENLQKDYAKNGKIQAVANLADAFFVETRRQIKNVNFGSVVILRGERLLIAEFLSVPSDKVIELAKSAADKL